MVIKKPKYRFNNHIQSATVRLITENGSEILSLAQAIQRADSADTDLVEVAEGNPPVCKLIDYDKFVYQQDKAAKSKVQHQPKLKQLSVSCNISEHDLEHKLRSVEEWLSDGSKVQVSLRYRGRENKHREFGREVFQRIVEAVDAYGKLEGDIKENGSVISMLLTKK